MNEEIRELLAVLVEVELVRLLIHLEYLQEALRKLRFQLDLLQKLHVLHLKVELLDRLLDLNFGWGRCVLDLYSAYLISLLAINWGRNRGNQLMAPHVERVVIRKWLCHILLHLIRWIKQDWLLVLLNLIHYWRRWNDLRWSWLILQQDLRVGNHGRAKRVNRVQKLPLRGWLWDVLLYNVIIHVVIVYELGVHHRLWLRYPKVEAALRGRLVLNNTFWRIYWRLIHNWILDWCIDDVLCWFIYNWRRRDKWYVSS